MLQRVHGASLSTCLGKTYLQLFVPQRGKALVTRREKVPRIRHTQKERQWCRRESSSLKLMRRAQHSFAVGSPGPFSDQVGHIMLADSGGAFPTKITPCVVSEESQPYSLLFVVVPRPRIWEGYLYYALGSINITSPFLSRYRVREDLPRCVA